MSLKRISIFLILFSLLGFGSIFPTDFAKGKSYNGFELLEKRFVKEVNADCYYFKHTKSGAKLFKIAADDPNKTFVIAFHTNPESDAGTPHIMEHSVLNGSKKFPVKSPFDVIVKFSLNTFVNAFTGDELTAYPIASKNEKDYFNLMDIYLDAVFNPLIYEDPRILKQEGWHYELTRKDNPIEYRGIVYNEMKGAYSSPARELEYYVQKNLFPDNPYQFSSGGYPSKIPTLNYEYFLDYHSRYYHPSNAHILLYGDADFDKELRFIDKNYLSGYEASDIKVEYPLQKPFEKMKELTKYYSVTEDAETKDQTFLTLSYAGGLNTDAKFMFALDMLVDLLVNLESAPIRLALQKEGIGKEVTAYSDDLHQPLVQIRVQNANPEDKARFLETVNNTLKEVVQNGFDKGVVEGLLNRMEFNLREGDNAQKGLNYAFQMLNGWFFASDPFLGIEYEKSLAELKKDIQKGYLEKVVREIFIDNNHVLLLDMQPKPGLEKEITADSKKECEQYKSKLSDDELTRLIKETEELIAYQKEEDSPEALATIPMLELSDVNPKVEWYDVNETEFEGVKLLHHDKFTNNVVYADFYYDMRVLPVELIPYAALLTELMSNLNTENYSYGELEEELSKQVGGFNIFLQTYLEDNSDEVLIPKIIVESKATNDKLGKLFELSAEIVNKTKYADKDRLKALLTRHQSRTEANVKNNGIQYAIRRMESYYSNRGMFNELTSGCEYYNFVSGLAIDFDKNSDEIIKNLITTAGLLFSKENLIVSVTGSKNDLTAFKKGLSTYIAAHPSSAAKYNNWKFNFEKKNEGLLTASKVQYVLQGYDFKKLGYEWTGKMRVMNKIISREWLYNRIRVVGGAYGGSSNFSSTGRVFLYSYRDPNLKETFDNFAGIPEFLASFNASEKDMTGFILGTIGDTDTPLTPSQQGEQAFTRYFQNITKADLQKERDEILSTTLADVKSMKKLLADILAQNNYCVYGNEEKIKENKELFGELVQVVK